MKTKKQNWNGIDRAKIQWFPTIDYKKCAGCMACVNFCTHDVYAEKDGKPKVANPNNCVVGCTGCDNVCPQKAISHPPKSYLEKLAKNAQSACSCGGKCGGKCK